MFVKEVTVGRPPVHLRMGMVARSTCHVAESTDTHNSVHIPGLFSSVARPLAMLDSWWPRLGDPLSRPAVVTRVSCFLSEKRQPRGRRAEVGAALFPPNLHSRTEGRGLTATVKGPPLPLGVSGSWGAQNQLQLFRARGGSPRRFPWFVFSIFHLFVCVFGT